MPENLAGQAYDEPGSWWRLSTDWPETRDRAEAKWVFLNKLKNAPVPYGSYVLGADVLRVSTQEYMDALNKEYEAAGRPSIKYIMGRYTQAIIDTPGSSEWPRLDKWW